MSRAVRLKDLEIHNFKGIRNLAIKFNSGQTEITGRNASGKTTIADAFAWLLWGLNSDDQQTTKFGIKPNDAEGKPQLDLNTEVEGKIEVLDKSTGEIQETKLKRRWVSVFRTKNGEVEKEFVKNKGEYFIDDVPVKESEYKTAVEAILPPNIFRTITNPYHFPKLHWSDKREILLQMAGDISIKETASRTPEFEKFLDELSGKSLEAFLKQTNADIARINTELAQIPVRIDEIKHNQPEAQDWTKLEEELKRLTQKKAVTEGILQKDLKAIESINQQAQLFLEKKASLQKAQAEALAEARMKALEEANEVNQARRALEMELQKAESELRMAREKEQNKINELQYAIRLKKEKIERLKNRQNELRDQWWAEHNKKYPEPEALICPLTNKECEDAHACHEHASNYRQSREIFEGAKEETKNEITKKGQQLETSINIEKGEIEKAQQEIEESLRLLNDIKTTEKIEKIKFQLSTTPAEIQPQEINPEDLPKWKELQEEIDKIQKEANGMPDAIDTYTPEVQQNLREDINNTNKQIKEITDKLADKETIARGERRIADLERAEKELLQQRANLQKKQAMAERLTKAHMTEVEERVNKLFEFVHFQMFEPTATTGDEKPNCVMWVDNVKYEDKNKAGKINAGLDVINTLCRHYGINAPIFIDNAESVNEFIPTESQIVLLKVSEDELKIK